MMLYFVTVALSVLVFTSLWFLYGERVGRLDIADEAWGLAQPYIVLVALLIAQKYSISSIILLILTFVWGYRLFNHLHKRHAKSTGEDIRYAQMRARWKKFPRLKSYIYVFLLQGFLMYLLGMGSMLLVFSKTSWNPLSLFGIAIWVIGFIFEVIADRQLKYFIARPKNKGKIMDQGLWKYSRHPNYFGEVVMWWGIFVFVFINTGNIWSIVTPITITVLIIFVSGIPLTEKHFESNPLWQKYKSKTSALIPWLKRK